MIKIPNGAKLYIDRVFSRCDSLISSHIWAGLNRRDLYLWGKSFSGIQEQYFSALLLDGLTFRSADQTKALMIQAIQKVLPDLLRDIRYYDKFRGKWLETLTKSSVPIRMVPVLRDNDGPGKSGHTICREYQRLLGFHKNLIISPEHITKAKMDGVKLFIFVDDFVGTGIQFSKFYEQVKSDFDESCISCYLPLCAHEKGVVDIVKNYPNLRVSAPDFLTQKDSFFSEDEHYLPDKINKHKDLKEFTIHMTQKRLGEKVKDPIGYGDLALLYGFSHSTPNATLPILWSRKNRNTMLLIRG